MVDSVFLLLVERSANEWVTNKRIGQVAPSIDRRYAGACERGVNS